jgi:hypothetical protein
MRRLSSLRKVANRINYYVLEVVADEDREPSYSIDGFVGREYGQSIYIWR